MDDDGAGPSLPSNYLTFLQLKQRWLQQQQQQSSATPNNESDPQSTHKPKHDDDDDDADDDADDADDDSTSKPPIQSVIHRSRNHHPNRIINQKLKPDVTLQDSASKTPKQVIPYTRNHHRNRVINQSKPDVTPHDSASKTPKKVIPLRRNHHRVVNQLKPEVNLDDSSSASKTLVEVADNHQTVEKNEQNTDQSSSKPSTTNSSSRRQNPRVVTDQIPTAVAPEKKQSRNRRRNRSQELRQPKAETPPRAPVVDALSQNDCCGVEAVAAAVKEINVAGVRRRTDGRWGSGRFYGGPAKTPVKKGPTTTTVWVRKGESGSN